MVAQTPQVIAILGALVEERVGLHYGEADHAIFGERVAIRALEAGYPSLLDYYYFLRYDDPGGREFAALVDALVVGETYFFRELEPMEVLVTDFLGPAVKAGHRPRVWSAASATGEEPLSLAMLLARQGVLDRVELVASDVSARALARAARGEFGLRAVRGPLPPGCEQWLTVVDGRPRVAPALSDTIRWRRVNITAKEEVAALGTFDAIVCRNVLIYFRDEKVLQVVESLSDALEPGGVLLVGVSESLLRYGTALRCEEHRGVFWYRKAATQ